MKALYERRRDLVCDALSTIGLRRVRPRGAVYVWVPVPDGFADAAVFCEHVLEEAAVVLSPGSAYGPNGEGFFRVSTIPDERLAAAVRRLSRLA